VDADEYDWWDSWIAENSAAEAAVDALCEELRGAYGYDAAEDISHSLQSEYACSEMDSLASAMVDAVERYRTDYLANLRVILTQEPTGEFGVALATESATTVVWYGLLADAIEDAATRATDIGAANADAWRAFAEFAREHGIDKGAVPAEKIAALRA